MIFPVLKKTDICKFLELAENIPVIDVRSPSEFHCGHIPGAYNIPLFDDRERETVGIKYKKEGRSKAIMKGIELTGPAMHLKLKEAIGIAKNGKLLVHCWRGGMRSEAMAWLFSLGDIETEVLEKGYKAYRNYILTYLAEKRKVIILGGMTGSSKTKILNHLENLGQQVIDLERLANHKGSAFGALGQPPQPSSEHFANLLFNEWKKISNDHPVWLEDESRNIGTVFMPDVFYNNLQESPSIILLMEIRKRLPLLIKEYSTYPPEMLKGSILKISKRIGGDNARDALNAIDNGDFEKAVEITLKYYDKTYMYGIRRKPARNLIFIETDSDDIDYNAKKVLEAANKITC
jgi:tRNA 2-selenouridine synthase